MKNCLLVGRTNVGKTLFCLNFAEYLGLKRLDVYYQLPDGSKRQRKYEMSAALAELPGTEEHHTRNLQSIQLELPLRKGVRQFRMTDSTGLSDGIHPDADLRKSMAQTLLELQTADVIFHLIDLNQVRMLGGFHGLGELDYQIAEFGRQKKNYLMLANKVDLPEAKSHLPKLLEEIPKVPCVPISAKFRQGFREVKEHVWRMV
ncbi:MAG: hypothetical protein JWN30_553 [Bacilli bacterium]|nr:hypothetical protein [Bacilli bacterium]